MTLVATSNYELAARHLRDFRIRKKTPATEVITWLDDQDEASLFISVITLGEIEKGILKLRAIDARRSQKLTAWLGKVEQRFAGRILQLDAAALYVWAQIATHAEQSWHPLPVMACLFMATAQCQGLTVAPCVRLVVI